MKRLFKSFIALTCALTMILSLAFPVMAAKKDVTLPEPQQNNTIVSIPDFAAAEQDIIEFEELSISSDGIYSRKYDGDAWTDCKPVIEDYVELLCKHYDFELSPNTPYYWGYKSYFYEYILIYTGNKKIGEQTIDGVFTDDKGHIRLYGTVERGNITGNRMSYVPNIEMTPSMDSSTEYNEPVQIEKNSYGIYQTADERLQVEKNEAMVLGDGQSVFYPADFVVNTDDKQQQITVMGRNNIPYLYMYFPTSVDFTQAHHFAPYYFVREQSYVTSTKGLYDNIPKKTWPQMFSVLHNDSYVIPITAMSGEMTELNVQQTYDTEDNVVVFYISAAFKNAPQELEMLIAVESGNIKENLPDYSYEMNVGETITIKGPRTATKSYELWSWEVLKGADLISLSKPKSQSCRITAKKSGTVRVKCTFKYTVKEPDVLTGNPTNVGRSMAKEYEIVINK